MRNFWALILCIVAGMPLTVSAQEKSQPVANNAALEKELFALELKWMKAESDKKMTGPDSMGELWTDEFFDVLPGGRVVNKQEMMDLMAKTDRQPGTGAFPDHFNIDGGIRKRGAGDRSHRDKRDGCKWQNCGRQGNGSAAHVCKRKRQMESGRSWIGSDHCAIGLTHGPGAQ
jgi:hypothetical protein